MPEEEEHGQDWGEEKYEEEYQKEFQAGELELEDFDDPVAMYKALGSTPAHSHAAASVADAGRMSCRRKGDADADPHVPETGRIYRCTHPSAVQFPALTWDMSLPAKSGEGLE